MQDAKVSLSFLVPGTKKYSKQECLKQLKGKKVVDTSKYETDVITISRFDKKVNKQVHEKIVVHTRKNRPIKQCINLIHSAYYYYISMDSCPEDVKINDWRKMSQIERLENHLKRIVDSLQGESFTYQIFED